MYCLDDNIVALATSPGRSALNIVRCSGSDALKYIKMICEKKVALKSHVCFLSNIKNPQNNETVDQAMVVAFFEPISYTGENVVELTVHGGSVIAKKIINVLISLGCRQALPGEFTYRAFINGKIDLIQAESINSIINTNKNINAFYALKNIGGGLSVSLKTIKEELTNLITYIEHELDFTDEEIEHKSLQHYQKRLTKIINLAQKVHNSSFVGTEKEPDVEICIVGRPNVGKSSLFNELVGHERSIVTKQPGTTRDFIDASFLVNDMEVRLVDTAGLRKTKNIIETQGIKHSLKKASNAHIILIVSDKNPIKEVSLLKIKDNKNQKLLFVQNKTDKNNSKKTSGVFLTSCIKKTGIRELYTGLSTLINKHRDEFILKNKFIMSERASSCLEAFIKTLTESKALLLKERDLVVVVSKLYQGLDKISSSLHPVNKDDIINDIFRGFCVGK